MDLKKINNTNSYKKDSETGAILNVDSKALEQYKKRKKIATDQQEEINSIKQQLTELKELVYRNG